VVRGEEWLPSLPIHVELFEDLGWELPVYCHTAQLMKIGEDGNKRKLSKRFDPELSLDYYRKEGYHPAAVREYLLTILNSNYEEWRIENPDAPAEEFKFTTEKMSSSGALFDLNKLNDVSKNALLHIDARELAEWLKSWSDEFAPEYGYAFKDMDYLAKILDIGRHDARPRADLVYAKQIMEFIGYFFDEAFEIKDEYPEEAAADAAEIIREYLASYDHSDDSSQWFGKIREITSKLGYAVKPKDYKNNPGAYKGHVSHVSTVIRIALVWRAQSPDVWTIQQIMGEEKVRARLEAAL
jgi:glutamyl-tRNA synthetase